VEQPQRHDWRSSRTSATDAKLQGNAVDEVLGTHKLHDEISDGETDRSGTSLRTGATGSNREAINVAAGWPCGAGWR
jgi:hypothetical protein